MHHHAERHDDSFYESSLTGRTERTGARGRAMNHPPGRGSGVAGLLKEYATEHDAQDRHAVVRNGYLPSPEVLTGVSPVRVPRTRGRSGAGRCFREEDEAGGGGDSLAVPQGDIDEREMFWHPKSQFGNRNNGHTLVS